MRTTLNLVAEPFEFEPETGNVFEEAAWNSFEAEQESETKSHRLVRRPMRGSRGLARSTSRSRPAHHSRRLPRRPMHPPRRWHRGPLVIRGDSPMSTAGSEFVRWVQHSLNFVLGLQLSVNGIMSAETRNAIRSFQQREGLPVDGIVGPDTQEALVRARSGAAPPQDADDQAPTSATDTEWEFEEELEWLSPTGEAESSSQPVLRRGSSGSAVRELQARLAALGFSPGSIDGIFGLMTEQAVKAFQSSRGLTADGIVGPQTWGQLYAQPSQGTPQPSPSTAAGEPQVTISSGVLISNNAVQVLKDILRLAGLSRATVTSGRRTPADQARIMYDLIQRYGVSYARNLYASTGDKVIDVYSAQKAAGKSTTAIKQAMEAKILELGPQNVSHHCSDSHDVFDVGPSSISDQNAFRAALNTALRNGMIDKVITPPDDPAYHIEIVLDPTAHELTYRILRSPPLPLDAFVPDAIRFEMD